MSKLALLMCTQCIRLEIYQVLSDPGPYSPSRFASG